MTNYREILRLKSLGFNHSQIAASAEVSRQTAVTALQKAEEAGLNWQTASELSDIELARLLFPQSDGQPTLADAICDRIVHDSYTIVIGGEDSMRKRKGISEA